MNSAITGFIRTWSPSFCSTTHRVEMRNVRQGGNDFLAVTPLALQAIWGGTLMAQVASVTSGPFRALAQIFRLAFHPVISVPLSVVSCAVKEHFYESSVTATLQAGTKYYARGEEVENPIYGTVTLLVNGRPRHFILGKEVTYEMDTSIEFKGKRYRYYSLQYEPFDPKNPKHVEIELNGKKQKICITQEIPEEIRNCVELTFNGNRHVYSLEREVAEPIRGTVAGVGEWSGYRYTTKHYLIGEEISEETPDCIKIRTEEKQLSYATGIELKAPTDTSLTFQIEGKEKHFAGAKYLPTGRWGLSGYLNLIPKLPFQLPTRLSQLSREGFELANRQFSNVIRLSILVAGVALIALGQYSMAAGALGAVAYEYLDHDLGVVPGKVSTFMEKWMPTISLMGLLIVGTLSTQILSGAALLLMIPQVNQKFHQKLSNLAKKGQIAFMNSTIKAMTIKSKMDGWSADSIARERKEFEQGFKHILDFHTLAEADQPLVEQKTLTLAQIRTILSADLEAFEINPAHLTKNYEPSLQLPQDRDFSKLTKLWGEIGAKWREPATYKRLMGRLIDDKRFILFLEKEKFPAKRFRFEKVSNRSEAENLKLRAEAYEIFKNQMEEWVQTLAEKGNCTKQEFVASWVKQQLEFFVAKLSGTRPIEGERSNLNAAIENTAIIIPFLLDSKTSLVDKEGALVKLAIEGGDYCALAQRRASNEVREGFTEPLFNSPESGVKMNEHQRLEQNVRYALQKERKHILQCLYDEVLVPIFRQREETQDVGEDVHLHTALERAAKRGVYPLGKEEMSELTLWDILFRESLGLAAQLELMRRYVQGRHGRGVEGLKEILQKESIDPKDRMRSKILHYLRASVAENPQLSEADRKELLEENTTLGDEEREKRWNGILSNSRENFANYESHEKWGRLFLYMIGIIREKKDYVPKEKKAV